MSEPLMSCPFCGAADDELKLIEVEAQAWAVTCNCCTAIGPTDFHPASAALMWNGSALHALGRVRVPPQGAVMMTRVGRAA